MLDNVTWPSTDYSRVPYVVFGDQAIYNREQERIFQGSSWCYLGLEAEIPNPGDFKTSFVGNTSVVVNRSANGAVYAFDMYPEGAPAGNKFQSAQVAFQ